MFQIVRAATRNLRAPSWPWKVKFQEVFGHMIIGYGLEYIGVTHHGDRSAVDMVMYCGTGANLENMYWQPVQI